MNPEDVAELRRKAYNLAEKYERQYGGCSQCVLGAIKDTVGGIGDDVFKAGTGLAGGIGLTGNSCGALTGGVMAISSYLGREYANFADPDRVRFKTFELAAKLQGRFAEEYGTSLCRQIQKKTIGKSFDLWNKEEYKEFIEAGGHTTKCPSVCGFAAACVIDLLYEAKLIQD